MPRTARILLPHTPHHVVQRGHNRANVFAAPRDYRYYLDTLIEWKPYVVLVSQPVELAQARVRGLALVHPQLRDVGPLGRDQRALAGDFVG